MFKCIDRLRSLFIDLDSFDLKYHDPDWWQEIVGFGSIQSILFITADEDIAHYISRKYGPDRVSQYMDAFREDVPDITMHMSSLIQAGFHQSETAYVSADYDFIRRAMCFPTGTIWCARKINFENVSCCPDLIYLGAEMTKKNLMGNARGFIGEELCNFMSEDDAYTYAFDFMTGYSGFLVHVTMLGRSFSAKSWPYQLVPFSHILNKKMWGKPEVFERVVDLYSYGLSFVLNRHPETFYIYSVPPKEGEPDYFAPVVRALCKRFNRAPDPDNLVCVKEMEGQTGISDKDDRWENTRDAFRCRYNIYDVEVVLLDDILATGYTLSAACEALIFAKAAAVYPIVLSVNQINMIPYWQKKEPAILCPSCHRKMILKYRGEESLYSCICGRSISWQEGRERVFRQIDAEI